MLQAKPPSGHSPLSVAADLKTVLVFSFFSRRDFQGAFKKRGLLKSDRYREKRRIPQSVCIFFKDLQSAMLMTGARRDSEGDRKDEYPISWKEQGSP